MISMTGYGRAVVTREDVDVTVTVEMRSVNHRFIDVKVRGVGVTQERAIETLVRAGITRGAVTVQVHVERTGAAAGRRIDIEAAKAVHRVLRDLADNLGAAPPSLELVLAQPGVVASGKSSHVDDDASGNAVIDQAVQAAMAELIAMRAVEGNALAVELGARLHAINAIRAQLDTAAATVPTELARRLHERLARALGDANPLDASRLEHEVALLVDRSDVTEELVRLGSHLAQLTTAMAPSPQPNGRKIDFLLQEVGREFNTIGSKAPTAEIVTLVVAAKAELEKLREQAQNVE